MDAKLLLQALGKYVCGAALTALLVFLPAGTLRFWNGQVLMAVLFLPMLLLGCVMFVTPRGSRPAGELELKLAQTVACFLGKQMEN